MKKLATLFRDSYQELKKVSNICAMAMFAAVAVVLGSAFTLELGPGMKIGFSSIANQCVYYLFGPSVGVFFGGALDLLKYMIKPTGPFFIGYTFNAMLAGLLYGIFYYKKPLSIGRILLAEFAVAMICNVWLNTQWLALTGVVQGKGFLALLPARLIKNLVLWPCNALLFYTIASTLEENGVWKAFRAHRICISRRKG